MLRIDSIVDAELFAKYMLTIDSTAVEEKLPKRNGWLRYACSTFAPALKKPAKEEFIEKPVKTIPSEMVGYILTRAYVWADPNECLGELSGPSTSAQTQA